VEPQRDYVRVVPVGEFDMAGAPVVAEELEHLIAAAFPHVALDLRRTTFIDLSGLYLILAARRRAEAASVRLTVLPGRPAVQRMFEVAGVRDRIFGS
jgi:anti-anti-sigma factor